MLTLPMPNCYYASLVLLTSGCCGHQVSKPVCSSTTVLCCIVLHLIALHCIGLHCIVLRDKHPSCSLHAAQQPGEHLAEQWHSLHGLTSVCHTVLHTCKPVLYVCVTICFIEVLSTAAK